MSSKLKSGLTATSCGLAGMAAAAAWLPSPERAGAFPSAVRGNRPPAAAQSAVERAPASVQALVESLRNAGGPGDQLAAALRFATLTDPEEIRHLLDQSRQFPAHSAGLVAVQTLLKRWLELDPDAAVDYCAIHFQKTLPKLVGTWCLTDPAKAEAFVASLPAGEGRVEAWQQLCEVAADRDPEHAWDLLSGFPGTSGQDMSYRMMDVVNTLAGKDLEGTMARLSILPSSVLKCAREAIAEPLMEKDPARGWDWVREQPNPNPLISTAIRHTLDRNPSQALGWLSSLPAAQRKRIQNEHGYDWGGKDSPAIAAALVQNSGFTPEEKQDLAQRFLQNASWQDPVGAEFFLRLLDAKHLAAGMESYLKSREQKTGPDQVDTWIACLPPGEVRAAVTEAWETRKQPEPEAVRTAPDGLIGELRIGSYIQENNSKLAQISAVQLGEIMNHPISERSYISAGLFTGLAKINPAAASGWLASVPMDRETGKRAAQFSATWAQEDPAAAAAWVNTLPAGDLANTAAANVARQFQRYDPAAATVWVAGLPSGPVRDAALSGMETR